MVSMPSALVSSHMSMLFTYLTHMRGQIFRAGTRRKTCRRDDHVLADQVGTCKKVLRKAVTLLSTYRKSPISMPIVWSWKIRHATEGILSARKLQRVAHLFYVGTIGLGWICLLTLVLAPIGLRWIDLLTLVLAVKI